MKEILLSISLIIALAADLTNNAKAEPLHPYEQQMFDSFKNYPEQREAITTAFWKYMEDEIRKIGKQLPIPAGPFASIYMIQMKPGLIVYHITLVPKHWDQALPTREQVVNHLCNDDRAILYLVVFHGVLTYESYRGNSAKSENTITVDGNDCRSGI